MSSIPVITIFDVGKTNKKLLVFDEQYKIVFEESRTFVEIKDEDEFPCENISAITAWAKDSFNRLLKNKNFNIKAINFSAYGASFVYLDEHLKVILPLYNYLKPYPEILNDKFYHYYGGQNSVALQTASPASGSLNSGMQLYRLKHEKGDSFDKIKYALHLPQYLSFIFTGTLCSDITSIGCHTNLWDFQNNKYHSWVSKEGIDEKLQPIKSSNAIAGYVNETIPSGTGLHDSSAALIPYLSSFSEPFVLISTGTWCITLNPFNDTELTEDELHHDCLCYLSYKGKPVKASRLFAGFEHEQQIKKLSEHFNVPSDYYKTIKYNSEIIEKLKHFKNKNLYDLSSYEEAYHQLISDIISEQVYSTNLVLKNTPVKQIFVDGGFSSNAIFMTLLAEAFSGIEVYAASVSQTSALGAALAIHKYWNKNPLQSDFIELKSYTYNREIKESKRV